MNTLSYKTEHVDLEQGDGLGKYLAFYFFVDGNKIESSEYNPANCFDILDERASNNQIMVLTHCACGVWECSSLVARVKYLPNDIVEWTVDELRYPNNPQKYFFTKNDYESVIKEVRKIALREAAEKKIHLNNIKSKK